MAADGRALDGFDVRAWRVPVVGRRGEFLLFLFLLDMLYALSLARPAPASRQSPSIRFLTEVMPLPWWAVLWLTVGLICVVGAFGPSDRVAFAFAAALKVLWGGLSLVGWIVGVIERGWVSAVIWLAFAFFVIRIASWPEPAE